MSTKSTKNNSTRSAAKTSWKAAAAFEAGQHREVVQLIQPSTKDPEEAMALIGSLAFLGRTHEAIELWAIKKEKLNGQQRARVRFAIAIAHTRASRFTSARKWLKESLDDIDGKKFADTYQGVAIYHYYLGKFPKAASNARKALRLSMENNDAYMRAFATDLYGHSLIQVGNRSAGMQRLAEARDLVHRKSKDDPFGAALLIYEAEAGVRPKTIVSELENRIAESGDEDTFTRGNLALELARQYTLRGEWKRARDLLDRESHSIYASENRRQEALLQLRLAEIAYRQGDGMSAKHFLFSARRCLNKIADAIFEIRILGLEQKVDRDLFNQEPSTDNIAKLQSLSISHPSPINARILNRASGNRSPLALDQHSNQDPLGALIDRSVFESLEGRNELLSLGYLGLWAKASGIQPGKECLILLETGWAATTHERVEYSENTLSNLSIKILTQLARGPVSKETLIEKVWGYTYDPLRHDSIIYAALGSLRRSLGNAASWVQSREDGWILQGTKGPVELKSLIQEVKATERLKDHLADTLIDDPLFNEDVSALNWRQLKAARAKDANRWTISNYKKVFSVSTMTAWRDLDGLVKTGYLMRIGRGRATIYLKGEDSV